jgi:hypothetical protein
MNALYKNFKGDLTVQPEDFDELIPLVRTHPMIEKHMPLVLVQLGANHDDVRAWRSQQ